MSLVTWLTKNLTLGNQEEYIKAEVLFDTYNIDTILERKNDVDYHTFCQILLKVFEIESKRKLVNKQKYTLYNLQWKNQDNLLDGKIFDQLKLTNLLKDLNLHVPETSTNSVKVNIPTGWMCNGNEVNKVLVFNSNMMFDVYIREQNIDLQTNYIEGTYQLTSRGIGEVLEQVKCIQLCQGISLKTQNYKPHANILHETITKQDDKNSGLNILRSKLCKQYAMLNSKLTPNCRTCRRLTVNFQEKTAPPSVADTLRSLMPTASQATLTFLESQVKNSKNECSSQNRWDNVTINECLNLYNRSPEGYKSLKKSGLLLLPSPSLLLLYKNSSQHSPGFHENIFRLMYEEANRMGIPPEGRVGGILIDEMVIQEKIKIVKQGKESEAVDPLKSGGNKKEIGTPIRHMIFMGLSGFRFPFAHFVSHTLSVNDLYTLFWEAVNILHDFEFSVKYVCMDGAVNNRSFMHIHFPDKQPTIHNMTSKCPSDPTQHMIFLMHPSHAFKKLRNNVLKSGNLNGHTGFQIRDGSHTRLLTLPSGATIQWSMWINAYKWDCQNPVQIHHKLTNEHLYPSSSSKMRNKLAEDVLDTEMLNLMLAYRDSLGEKGTELNGAIEFLQKTSKLINIFRDKHPLHRSEDDRLRELQQLNTWFDEWQNSTLCSDVRSGNGSTKLSLQCMEDVQSTILGFQQLCYSIFSENNGWSVIPAMINSDLTENHVCQQCGKFKKLNAKKKISKKSENSTKNSASVNSRKRQLSSKSHSTQPVKVTKLK